MPRPVKSVDFSSCTEAEQQKRGRRKWKSFNAGSSVGTPVHAINNNRYGNSRLGLVRFSLGMVRLV